MFRIVPNPTFVATAKVMVPSDEGPQRQDLKARFRFLADDEIPSISGRDGGTEFLREVTVELSDMVDEKGEAVEFTRELFERLLKLPYVRNALVAAYFAGQNGAALGN